MCKQYQCNNNRRMDGGSVFSYDQLEEDWRQGEQQLREYRWYCPQRGLVISHTLRQGRPMLFSLSMQGGTNIEQK